VLQRDLVVIAEFFWKQIQQLLGNRWISRTRLTLTVKEKLVPNQRFLEMGAHEAVTSSGLGEDGEMDPKE
jgi:hypothetical protein